MAQDTQLADYLASLRQQPPVSLYPAALGATPKPSPDVFSTAKPNVKLAEQPSLEAVTGPKPSGDVQLPAAAQPNAFASSTPKVQLDPNPLNQIEGHEQNQLNKLEQPGKQWADRSTMGKVGHVLAVAGNIAGDIVAPGAMERIPGTMLNKQMRESNLKKGIEGIETQKSKEGLENAQAENQGAEAGKAKEETAEMPGKTQSEEGLQSAEAAKDSEPNLASAYAHRVNQVLAQNGDPSTDPVVQHLADAITSIQKQTAGTNKTIQREVNGKPHTIMVDEKGNDVRDLGETGEKPATVNVNTATNQLDKESQRYAKPYAAITSSAATQLEKIDEARLMVNGNIAGQGLAAAKVLTALVSGTGTGVRITMPELQMFMTARSITGSAEAFVNGIAGIGKFSGTQQKQITQLLDDVKGRLLQKVEIANEAQNAFETANSRNEMIQLDQHYRNINLAIEKGATGQVKGSDGKMHWTDGKIDLGVAN